MSKSKQKTKQQYLVTCCYAQENAGFTLLEVLVVLLMVGVLSAIAAPGWISFVNRQRVNKANDAVLTALQEAQRQAKKTKLSYSVSFQTDSNRVAKIAIYPTTSTPYWQNLGADLGISSGQVLLGTNLIRENMAGTLSYASYDPTKPQTITFDYTGGLANQTGQIPSSDSLGLKIVVAVPNSVNSTQPGSVIRCVIVDTLIGGMRTAKDSANCS
ncbi:MAG: prepilin-type N-terminal cleavage/methylation domain-containing protein [Rhizonema sp. PD38]|nr:prepilin-type N-terminal cleavage/methylation domain-containing protein [Rhizonema sp. PD38]